MRKSPNKPWISSPGDGTLYPRPEDGKTTGNGILDGDLDMNMKNKFYPDLSL